MFKRANGFDIYLDIKELGLKTDYVFESIPDKYIETNVNWKWRKKQLIPIIIPKDYLKLLNLGYAETKKANRIPLLSYDAVKSLTGRVLIESPKGKKHFSCRIVRLHRKKINSILVPENFIDWANENYGVKKEIKPNKILVEFRV